MPYVLLGDVLRAGDSGGRVRRWYILPLSIAAHALAGAAILIIPLAAEVELPVPVRPAERMFHVVPTTPRPVIVPPPKGGTPARAPIPPTEAPTGITEEKVVPVVTGGPPGPPNLGDVGVPDGFDIGVVGQPSVVIAPPPPAPVPQKPVPVGGKIREPRKIIDVSPIYPPIAVAARKEGVVILEATLDVNGNVDHLRVLRSEPLLDEAALQAVRRWRYTPTLLNGVPVPVLMTITVRFSLR